MAKPDLDSELDRLYALPLAEFIGGRNELAKRLEVAGEPAAAAEVKALAKPSVTAWAVNALFHRERERFDALLAAAAAVRAGLAGKGDRRQAEAEKRQALRTLLALGVEILSAAGHAAAPANRQRISHTLEALAARDPQAEGPEPGRLTADLEPQGFDVLAGLAASLAPAAAPPPRPGKGGAKNPAATATAAASKTAQAAKARDERLEEARRQLAEQEAALGRLEQEAEEAVAAAEAAAKRAERLAEEAAEAKRLASAAVKAAGAAKQDLAAARAAATKARAARRRGLTRVATARRRLERQQG